jgi:hypothetical protein
MAVKDKWERDPGVRTMRRIFGRMEEAQRGFLSSLGIDSHEPRLRGWREKALSRFERCWRIAASRGMKITEERMAAVYIHCLAAQMNLDGMPTEPALPKDPEIEMLVKEAGE